MFLFFTLSLLATLYIAFPDEVDVYGGSGPAPERIFYRVHGHALPLLAYYSAAGIFALSLCASVIMLRRAFPNRALFAVAAQLAIVSLPQ